MMSIIVGNRVYCKITALDDDDDVPRGSFQFPGQNFVNNIRSHASATQAVSITIGL